MLLLQREGVVVEALVFFEGERVVAERLLIVEEAPFIGSTNMTVRKVEVAATHFARASQLGFCVGTFKVVFH